MEAGTPTPEEEVVGGPAGSVPGSSSSRGLSPSAENVNHDLMAQGMWFPLAAPLLTAVPHQGSTRRQALAAPCFPTGSPRPNNCRPGVDSSPITTPTQDQL